ncbi:MAG: hypothetical protein WA977_08615 [Halobacteriota archaeon]
MTWSWVYGCANCTWQELAAVCGLAVLAFAVWWCGLNWMARKYEKLEKRNEDGEA